MMKYRIRGSGAKLVPRPTELPLSRVSVAVHDAIRIRPARTIDVPILASMNHDLILAEGGPSHLSRGQLTTRMASFLEHGHEAHLVVSGEDQIGYVLFRRDVDHVFIRQFYVASERRRAGIGRYVFRWLSDEVFPGERVVLHVRPGNERGLRFWTGLGFATSGTALEWSRQPGSAQVR
jgi:ribosomal protein S18 acetylase RimI-like enzyme